MTDIGNCLSCCTCMVPILIIKNVILRIWQCSGRIAWPMRNMRTVNIYWMRTITQSVIQTASWRHWLKCCNARMLHRLCFILPIMERIFLMMTGNCFCMRLRYLHTISCMFRSWFGCLRRIVKDILFNMRLCVWIVKSRWQGMHLFFIQCCRWVAYKPIIKKIVCLSPVSGMSLAPVIT